MNLILQVYQTTLIIHSCAVGEGRQPPCQGQKQMLVGIWGTVLSGKHANGLWQTCRPRPSLHSCCVCRQSCEVVRSHVKSFHSVK